MQTTRAWRFGVFEVDAQREEILRSGALLKIREQSFRVLVLLLEHAGELVTREDLRKMLWPPDTFVDFEHSLNAAIMKLRDALGDTAEKPLYIETVPRRGYRFIAPLIPSFATQPDTQVIRSKAPVSDPEPIFKTPTLASSAMHIPADIKMTAITVILISIVAIVWYLLKPLPAPRITDYVQLTNDGRYKVIAGSDGSNLYLNLIPPFENAIVSVSGGRLIDLPIDLPTLGEPRSTSPLVMAVSPDGSRLLIGNNWDPAYGRDLWITGNHGSTARYLTKGVDAAWSPDNRTIVYSDVKGNLNTIAIDGGGAKTLLASTSEERKEPWDLSLVWSPDGKKVRYIRGGRFWEVSSDGSQSHEFLPDWRSRNPRYNMGRGQWTPDGDFFLFTAWSTTFSRNPIFSQNLTTQIWLLDERRNRLRLKRADPIQLTPGALSWGVGGLTFSRDATRIYTTGVNNKGELVAFDPVSKILKPFFGGISAEGVDYAKDGRHLIYVSYPEGVLWKANRDGNGLMQLTEPPLYPVNPHLSPDASQIVFFDGSSSVIYVMPSNGGEPKRLLSSNSKLQFDPFWSPDGKQIIFTESSGTALTGAAQLSRILDLPTGKVTDLPPSPKPVFSLRWSPDGNHIAGINALADGLEIFDMQSGKWSTVQIGKGANCNWLTWSHDGRYLYYMDTDYYIYRSASPGIYRIALNGNKPEKVVDLQGFAPAGFYGAWAALDPDDNPLLLRDASTREIYALTLDRK